jgi:pyridoxal phosphate-dependent aminotransferase EpsN
MGERERELMLDAYDSNWVAPLGPHVDAFEREFAETVSVGHAAAVSSGTAALHLALRVLGIGPGDDVLVSSLTFVASGNAVVYVGAEPVFVDSDWVSWNMSPELLEEELERRARVGRLPAAVVAVDLYGQCADYEAINAACTRFGVPVVEDAAEALGATYRGRPAGSLGAIGVFSFNGNKIVTTSCGGMLVSDRRDWVDRARHLSEQAREPVVHYEHEDVGYNYRMSNVLAAIGRGQLQSLPERVARRREINRFYRSRLGHLPGIEFMPEASYGEPMCWLTCLLVAPAEFGASRDEIQIALEARDIEARPTWKPMHLQPVFAEARMVGGKVSEEIFERGLCLPSGSSLTDDDLERVVEGVLSVADPSVRA